MSLGKFSKNSFGKCAHLAIQIAAVSGEEIKLAYGFDQLILGGKLPHEPTVIGSVHIIKAAIKIQRPGSIPAGIRTSAFHKAAHHLIILFMIPQILSSGRLMDKIPDVKGCAVMIPRPIRWEIVFRLRPLPVGPPDHTATVGKTPRRPIPLSTVSAVHRPGFARSSQKKRPFAAPRPSIALNRNCCLSTPYLLAFLSFPHGRKTGFRDAFIFPPPRAPLNLQ